MGVRCSSTVRDIKKLSSLVRPTDFYPLLVFQVGVEDQTLARFVWNILSIATRKVYWRRASSRGGTAYSEPTPCSSLRLMLSPFLPTHFLEKSWLCMCKQNSTKSLVYIGGIHQVNCRREWIEPPSPLFPGPVSLLFLFSPFPLFLFHFLCLTTSNPDHPCGSTNMGSKDWWYCLLSFFCLGKIQVSHSTLYSVPNFVMGVGRLWRCIVAC